MSDRRPECTVDLLNPCYDRRPTDQIGRHWGGGLACAACTCAAERDAFAARVEELNEARLHFKSEAEFLATKRSELQAKLDESTRLLQRMARVGVYAKDSEGNLVKFHTLDTDVRLFLSQVGA